VPGPPAPTRRAERAVRRPVRAFFGVVVGVLARAWLGSLRVHVSLDPSLEGAADRPWVLAFWHGTQFSILAWRGRKPTVVLVSLSADGAMQARALAMLGLRVVRGSTSRAGARGLAALIRAMRRDGVDAAFAVDGPRGPRGRVQGGAVAAARAAGGVVVPVAGSMRSGVVLAKTWDRFAVAWPFTRVDVALGRPIEPGEPAAGAAIAGEIARLEAGLARP
jgi:lysophospholipid acyltransferase (LPLAT)-like uncharacterized protein